MTKAKKRKRQERCYIATLIHRIEHAISMTITIYRAVEPIVKAILTNGRKTK
jgi:hypothetical protein